MMSTLQGDDLGIVLQNPYKFARKIKVALREFDGDSWSLRTTKRAIFIINKLPKGISINNSISIP